MPAPSFLIVRVVALGDVALATPLLIRIRAENPDARITWLCGSGNEELVRLFPGVDTVIAVNEHRLFRGNPIARGLEIAGVWRQLLGTHFDHVLMLHPDPRYRILTAPIRRARTTYARHGPHAEANPISGRFRGDENARLLDGPISRGPIVRRHDMLDLRPHLGSPRKEDRRRVILVPGGARNTLAEAALKRWPVASYRALAAELLSLGIEVVLIGGADDAVFASEFHGMAVRDLVGKAAIKETLELMHGADLVISHDTGPLHLAKLVRAPTIAIFGPTDPAQFVGEDANVTVIWGGVDLACRPCYDGKNFARCTDNICINRVAVATVLAAVRKRLGV